MKDQLCVQQTANSIALMARNLAFDGRYMSPFAQRARDYGIRAIGTRKFSFFFFQGNYLTNFYILFFVGGKPDDITVLLATVAI